MSRPWIIRIIWHWSVTYPDVFGHTVTCTTSGLGETMTQPVALYENADGHLFDKIPGG